MQQSPLARVTESHQELLESNNIQLLSSHEINSKMQTFRIQHQITEIQELNATRCQKCESVLILDDDGFSAYGLFQQFSRLGFRVQTATSLESALSAVQRKINSSCCQVYKYITFDYNFGSTKGPVVCRQILEFYKDSEHLPICIACTGKLIADKY